MAMTRLGRKLVCGTGTIKLFLSSTFVDMRAERDHLITVVYPELEERLALLDLTFFDIDLRWGIPRVRDGEIEEPRNSWQECRRRVDEAYPFFVALIGHRYGSLPKPGELTHEETSAWGAERSYTELEVRYGAFGERPDGGAPKASQGRRLCFYFRAPPVAPGGLDLEQPLLDDPMRETYVQDFVKTHTGINIDAQAKLKALRAEIVDRSGLRGRLLERFRSMPSPMKSAVLRDYSCEWTRTGSRDLEKFGAAILEDLWRAILTHPEFVSQDLWKGVLPNRKDRRTVLNSSMPIPPFAWLSLVEEVRRAQTPLEKENIALRRFREERSRNFVGRKDELRSFRRFLKGEAGKGGLQILCAPPGRGKTAFLCKLAQSIEEGGDLELIECYVGATDRLTDLSGLLSRLIAHLAPNDPLGDERVARRAVPNELVGRLMSTLRRRRKPVAIIIDAVDQLSSGNDLSWLPVALPSSVRLLISIAERSDTAPSSAKSIVERRPDAIVKLGKLERRDVRAIAQQMMNDYGKELATSRLDAIASLDQTKEPLFLAVLMRELRSLSGEDVDAAVDLYLQRLRDTDAVRNASDLFRLMLGRLDVFGNALVTVWVTSLALTRNGLSPAVLAHVCSMSLGDAGAAASFRLARSMRPYLQRRGNRIDYFHLDVEAAVTERYRWLDQRVLHANIATALQVEWDKKGDAHAMAERFYHLVEAGDWDAALAALADFSTLDARFDLSGAGVQFSADVDFAYRTAVEGGRHDVAHAIVERFLAILKSDAARRAVFTLSRVSAWLSYRTDTHFYFALLMHGARETLSPAEIEALSDDERELRSDCLVRLAGVVRRDVDQHPRERLDRAEELLNLVLGDTANINPNVRSRIGLRLRSFLLRLHDRIGTAAYELAFIHFLRGGLPLSERWFRYAGLLSQAARDETGAAIAKCLAANCRFIERDSADYFEKRLLRARRVFDRRAEGGDPHAQRWITNVIAHNLEIAFARGDASAARRCFVQLQNDPWVVAFDADVRMMARYVALLAAVEGRIDEAISLFDALIKGMKDWDGEKARYIWHYGKVLEAKGDLESARRVWKSADDLPDEAGNAPWKERIRREPVNSR